MSQRANRALGEPRGVVPCRIVQRGQHDIEAGEGLVGEIEVAAGVDVDLDAMEIVIAG